MSVRILDCTEEVSVIVSEVAEGPIWDTRSQMLLWVDLNAGLIHRLSPSSGQLEPFNVGQHVGFIVPWGRSSYLAGLRDGFAKVSADGTSQVVIDVESQSRHLRMNDGKVDPRGRVWAGTMGIENAQPEGMLYCLNIDGGLRAILNGLTIPNGIDWSPDGNSMYFTDTSWGRVDRFDYDAETGNIANPSVFVEIPGDRGLPDGMCVDDDGCVWVALWYGAAVHRYTPEGQLDTIIRIPAIQATSCAFGGSDGKDLYITSASQRLSPQNASDHPRSGHVFVCRPGGSGQPARASELHLAR